jgi:hypothetical protein
MTANKKCAALRLGFVQYEVALFAAIRIEAQIMKQKFAESLSADCCQKPGRNNLVCIDVRRRHQNRSR